MTPEEERRAQRGKWPVRVTDLKGESTLLDDRVSASERLNMMWQLALDSWEWAGLDLPDYDRRNMPVVVLPSSEHTD